MKVQTQTTKTITLSKEEILEVLIQHLTDEGVLCEEYVISEENIPEMISVKLVSVAIKGDSNDLPSEKSEPMDKQYLSCITIGKKPKEVSLKGIQNEPTEAKPDGSDSSIESLKGPNVFGDTDTNRNANKTRMHDPFSGLGGSLSSKINLKDNPFIENSSAQVPHVKKTVNLFA